MITRRPNMKRKQTQNQHTTTQTEASDAEEKKGAQELQYDKTAQ